MPDYDRTRAYNQTGHEDTYDVGHPGEPMRMAQRVQTDLGKSCIVKQSGTLLRFTFEEALTTEEEALLDTAIANQKAVDDWPYSAPNPQADVNIISQDPDLDLFTTLHGFRDMTGHNVYRLGHLSYDIAPGVHNIFHEKFNGLMYISGGGLHMPQYSFDADGVKTEYKPCKGDYCTFDVVDIDNVLGTPYGNYRDDVTKVARSGDVATVTFATDHGFSQGDVVCINLDDDTFDDQEEAIASVPSSTTLTYANVGADVAEKDATGDCGRIVVVANFVPQDHIAPDLCWACVQDDAKPVPPGVYLRWRYVSFGNSALWAMPVYFMRT